jgi:hypothetical protein
MARNNHGATAYEEQSARLTETEKNAAEVANAASYGDCSDAAKEAHARRWELVENRPTNTATLERRAER